VVTGGGAPDWPVWLGDGLVAAADAQVSVFDRGLTVGDGAFETVKVVDGVPFALGRHIARLHRSTTALGLAVPMGDARLRGAVAAVLAETGAASGSGVLRLRITVTAGAGAPASGRNGADPTLVVTAAPQVPWEPETTAVRVPWPRNERSALAGAKVTSYAENVVALAEAHKVGATEAIMPNTRGDLCEGTGSNVFVAVGGRLVTPSLLSGCLPGVTRALVLEEVPDVEEDDLPLAVLDEADEVLLTSSTRDVQPLRAVDGRALPGVDGPWAQRLQAAWAALVARTSEP
jgi:branched-chain amino acid aminotransferase